MKAGGANRIRYPGSPSCKRCRLGVWAATSRPSAAGKLLSLPPGEYGRKAETQRNWRGSTTRGEACGLIGVNAGNLTGIDSSMKARLKVLLDELRGGAWPSPVRAVRCPVKSGNDRDPRPLLLLVLRQAH